MSHARYAMSRLTENVIFERARFYLVNEFKNYKTRSKISEDLWLRNEGLPNGEGLYQLYVWFCKERGYMVERVREDLEFLGDIVRKLEERTNGGRKKGGGNEGWEEEG